jgi:hypothetical protein
LKYRFHHDLSAGRGRNNVVLFLRGAAAGPNFDLALGFSHERKFFQWLVIRQIRGKSPYPNQEQAPVPPPIRLLLVFAQLPTARRFHIIQSRNVAGNMGFVSVLQN